MCVLVFVLAAIRVAYVVVPEADGPERRCGDVVHVRSMHGWPGIVVWSFKYITALPGDQELPRAGQIHPQTVQEAVLREWVMDERPGAG